MQRRASVRAAWALAASLTGSIGCRFGSLAGKLGLGCGYICLALARALGLLIADRVQPRLQQSQDAVSKRPPEGGFQPTALPHQFASGQLANRILWLRWHRF